MFTINVDDVKIGQKKARTDVCTGFSEYCILQIIRLTSNGRNR
jgi:hypothetical protein